MAIRLTTYEHAKDIPELPGTNVFHSTDLFRILEQTPGYRPVLLVAFEGDKPIGKLLCITRRNFRLLAFTGSTHPFIKLFVVYRIANTQPPDRKIPVLPEITVAEQRFF